ncbi:oxidoreductase [Paraburkholderia sp. BCC1885]|uniref:oxidoreductase n=1 Tax=Paraburkholderia sp. BCC1885 TaxID=2562669 RepID=UPI0011824C1D|nr:oxidoreductase [Paraburkholderia sp. BCC1885]
MSKVWLITGATRGIGAEIARAALAAGEKVVATGRSSSRIEQSLGPTDRLLALTLDVTDHDQAVEVARTAVERFGRIDVLVNNAGYGLIGAVEECSSAELADQFATNVLGVAAVTRAVLPIMRAQRSGHIFNMSSAAGIVAFPGASGYCSSKFAVEGLTESMAQEVAPLGIKVTMVEPGYMRTEFLESPSAVYAERVIDDYDSTAGAMRRGSRAISLKQPGDPRKLAQAFLTLASAANPPLRFVGGADSVSFLEQALATKREELETWRHLSMSLGYEE